MHLEARENHNLKRNPIVSGMCLFPPLFFLPVSFQLQPYAVCLRSLEYCQGILFITANLVGTFDEAFASRIHVQLHFKALDASGRKLVWQNTFHKLNTEGCRGGWAVEVDRGVKDYVVNAKDVRELT